MGPLHGLPVSVKEHIGMRGLGLNAGYAAWWDRVADADAHVLQILARAGAVFHARTTQPQSLMHLETDSNLYGVTVNPYDRRLSAGGSSGGEGALIALRGSVLGIGSDVGGTEGLEPSAALWRLISQQGAFAARRRTTASTVCGRQPTAYPLMGGHRQRHRRRRTRSRPLSDR